LKESAKEIFDKKVSLIYEYNKNSPLFVRMANVAIEENNIDAAIEFLQSGLKTYPNHPVAYLLLGKAHALMGSYGKALEYFKIGSDILGCDETYDYYQRELDSIKQQRSLFETKRSNSFFNSSKSVDDIIDENSLFNTGNGSESVQKITSSIDERLEQLAQQISKAKLSSSVKSITKEMDFLEQLSVDNMIVSETLAKIYVAQNEYDEAIKVYEKLIKKDSARYDYYSGKIKELRSLINS